MGSLLMIPSLRGTKLDGTLLIRRAETTLQISEFIDAGLETLVDRATSIDYLSSAYIKSETLLFFLRDSLRRNNQKVFNLLYPVLYQRIERIALKGSSEIKEQRRDHVLHKFNELIAKDRDSYEVKLDYLECSFEHVIACWRKDASRSIGRKRQLEEAFANEKVTDTASLVDKPVIADISRENMDPEMWEAFQFHVLPAIDSLPEQQKQVVIMTLHGYSDGSKDPDEITIASVLDCDRKTVFNLRNRAYRAIKDRCGVKLS